MKQKILFLFLLCMASMHGYSQSDNTLTIDTILTFSPEDFTIFRPDDGQGCLVRSDKYRADLSYGGLAGEPAMPFIVINIYHRNTISFSELQISVQEQLFEEDFVMMLNLASEPNNVYGSPALNRTRSGNEDSQQSVYPTAPVEFAIEVHGASFSDTENGYTVLRVYPFRYNAISHELFLNKTIQITIAYQVINPTTIYDVPNSSYVKSTYYDLSGCRVPVSSDSSVSSVLPKGVYIRDGKKVVVK